MKRVLALILLALAASGLLAQSYDELIELDTEALADSAWTEFYRGMAELGRPLKLDSRLYANEDGFHSLHSLLYLLAHEDVLLNYRRDWDSGEDKLNFRIRLHTDNFEAVLGSHRFRFGRGVLMGTGSRALPDSLFSLEKPLSPLSYVPLGAAAKYTYRHLRAGVFGSIQKREARLDDGLIVSLPATRTGALGSAQESVVGAIAGIQARPLRLAALLYWQGYDRSFADGRDSSIWGASLYSSLEFPANRIDAEAALLNSEPYGLANWRLKFKGFEQNISFARSPAGQKTAYSLNPTALYSAPGRDEIAWGLALGLPFRTGLALRYSLNSGDNFSGDDLSRLMAALAYRDSLSSLRLAFYSFDSEIISLVDTTYHASNPRDYRFRLSGKLNFRPPWYQELDLSYQLEDRSEFTQNTYKASLAVGYESGRWDLKAGYASWQSPRTFLAEDTLEPEYYSITTSDDSVLFASATARFKGWQMSASARKSLLNQDDFNIFLRFGLSLL